MRFDRKLMVVSEYAGKLGYHAKRLVSQTVDTRRKLMWRLANGAARATVPVFIFGSQRSGTTMLGECLGKSPEIENLGESDERAFIFYSLRDDTTVLRVIAENPNRFLVFKPLKDSHRVEHLLALCPASRGIWAYRHYADRINSAVRKFGRHPVNVLEKFKSHGEIAWQLQGLSTSDEDLIRGLDINALTDSDGAALMWYLRNALFFNQNLEGNNRVLLWSYEEFVSDPIKDLDRLTRFLGTRVYPYMTKSVHARSLGKNPRPTISPEISQLCDALYERLEMARKRQRVVPAST